MAITCNDDTACGISSSAVVSKRVVWSVRRRPTATGDVRKTERARCITVGLRLSLGFAAFSAIVAVIGACSPRHGEPALAAGQSRGANVLLVTIDTLRRDRVGAYGHANGLTPTLDRLAASGVRFAHATS